MNTTSLSNVSTPLVQDLVDAGLPADRMARLAARRAFVEMKQLFMRAVAPLRGAKGQWLRDKVRISEDPMDLWLLRGALMAELQGSHDPHCRELRAELYRGIDSTFPEALSRPNLTMARTQASPWHDQPTPLASRVTTDMLG